MLNGRVMMKGSIVGLKSHKFQLYNYDGVFMFGAIIEINNNKNNNKYFI